MGLFNQIGKAGYLRWFAGQLIYSDRKAGYLGCYACRLLIQIACLVILDGMLVS